MSAPVGTRPGAFRRFIRHKLAMFGMFILLTIIGTCVLGPMHLSEDLDRPNLLKRFKAPSKEHPMGTDDLGRDAFRRVLMGGRVSLLVGIVGALSAATLGVFIGGLAGLWGGWIDVFLMRMTDGFLALPLLPLMLILSAFMSEWDWLARFQMEDLIDPSVVNLLMIVIMFGWMTTARLVRASFLTLRETEFVLAARALGASPFRIAFVHMFPNSLAPILVSVTLTVGRLILYESVLSFLGLGVQLPLATWGNMLKGAEETIETAPWLAIYPGLFILFTVLSVNFIGDGMRDALDPKSTK